MTGPVRIQLWPLGKTIEVEQGTSLQEILFPFGVEFPCGGHGRCKACRVKVLQGSLPVTPEQAEILSPTELAEGWRLACRSQAGGGVTLEIRQWETAILADNSIFEFEPGIGLGIAVDLGTTTLVAQLLDLHTGRVLGVKAGLNPQAAYGGDVMSRVLFALSPEGLARMKELIRLEIAQLIGSLRIAAGTGDSPFRKIVVVGNTVMHHLFCGIDVAPLAHYPFQPVQDGLHTFHSEDLDWDVPGNPTVHFFPCLGGFVGSDILAGVLATGMHKSGSLMGLVDLGTNGEVVFGNRDRIVCASTAAGPAFEGARIKMGMRAATGAIAEVRISDGRLECRVLGGGPPRGLCGSGLVDAVAAGLDLGVIEASGRFARGIDPWPVAPPVSLCQNDIRELQLAKGAIAAAIQILLEQWDAPAVDVTRLFLAGAFGNYVDRASARRIGLINFPQEKVIPAGNTALLGAKLALFAGGAQVYEFAALRRLIEHVPLAADPDFMEVYVKSMTFP